MEKIIERLESLGFRRDGGYRGIKETMYRASEDVRTTIMVFLHADGKVAYQIDYSQFTVVIIAVDIDPEAAINYITAKINELINEVEVLCYEA